MHIILLKCQIAFLKFTSCDNQALVGWIPIAAVAVHLNLKSLKIGQSSHKMYSNNILNFQESMTILNACTKKKSWKLIECTIYLIMLSVKQGGIMYHFFESLVWLYLGLNPSLLGHWQTSYPLGQWTGFYKTTIKIM